LACPVSFGSLSGGGIHFGVFRRLSQGLTLAVVGE
jgi:hypothetical protein